MMNNITRSQQFFSRAATAALLSLQLTARAAQPAISIHFGVDEINYPGTTVNPGETAGVVPEMNWNNIPGAAASASNLIDASGSPTTANLSIRSPFAHYFIPVSGAAPDGDRHMMHGDIYAANPLLIDVTTLGTNYTFSGYDLYVYFQGDTASSLTYGIYPNLLTVYDTNQAVVLGGPALVWGAPGFPLLPFNGTFVLSDGNGGKGNYYKFSHLTSDSFRLQLSPTYTWAEMQGIQIEPSPPVPYVLSTAPSGNLVSQTAQIQIQLKDNVTQVNTNSIQLSLNGVTVAPTVAKPAGTNVTTITYLPPGGLDANTAYTVELVFSDNASPTTNSQDIQYAFTTLNNVIAGTVVNIDINGRANSGGNAQQSGVTFKGQGAAAGGTVFNGILGDSALPGGIDNNTNLTIGANNLLDSIGGNTTVSFSMTNVSGNNDGTANTAFAIFAALLGDFITSSPPNNAPFTISGLGTVPTIDLYLYQKTLPGALFFGGKQQLPIAFTASGNYTPGNTLHFSSIPVSGGTASGVFGNASGQANLSGLTIKKPAPGPYVKSVSPTGGSVLPNAVVKIELWNYITQVDTNSIQLFLNGSSVMPTTITKPTGTNVTTVTYVQPGDFTPNTTYTVDILFSDNSIPAIQSSNTFSFGVVSATYPTEPTISINFVSGTTPGTTTMSPSDVAGVVPVANWNNRADGVTSLSGLVDWNGKPTTASLNISGVNGTYQVGNSAPPGGDKTMMNGYIYAPNPFNISVSGLSSAYTGPGYNLYVYYRAESGAAASPWKYTVLDGAGNTNVGPALVYEDITVGFNGTYVASDGNGSAGNYYVFTNLTLPNFTLRASPTGIYTAVNGIQIESIPAPPPIAIKFGVDEIANPGTTINPGETAGVIPEQNWNNVPGTATSAPNLVDVLGNPTTAGLTIDGPLAHYIVPGVTATNLGDKHLMTGYIYYNGPLKMTLTGLSSYTNGTGYDLYVYALGDSVGGAQPQILAVSNAAGAVIAGPATVWASSTLLPFTGTFVQSDGKGSVGNYYKFSGLHLDTFKLSTGLTSNSIYTTLQGLEIVPHQVTPVTLVSAARSLTPDTKVTVTFSGGVSEITATNRLNYAINSGVSVISATLQPTVNGSAVIGVPHTVVLTTSPINNGNPNVLTVNGVQDLDGNVVNSQVAIDVPSDNFRMQDSSTNHLLVLEAEDYSMNTPGGGQSWTFTTSSPWLLSTSVNTNFSGSGCMVTLPNIGNAYSFSPGATPVGIPELDYLVDFTSTGTFAIWIRGSGDSDVAGQNDSINLGLDGVLAYRINGQWPEPAGYSWGSAPTPAGAAITVPTTGIHTVNVWMREDGFVFDKLVLSSNPNYNPTGIGPAESPLAAPSLSTRRLGTNLVLTWSGGGTLQSSTNVKGPYGDIIGSNSPWTVSLTNTTKFYRVRK